MSANEPINISDFDLKIAIVTAADCVDFEKLEKHLKIKSGTFANILKSDSDWSMIIKIGVLLEATLDSLLAQTLTQIPSEFFAKLNIGGRTGKAELAASMGLIDKTTKGRIDAIMQIRNNFAHKLEFIDKDFLQYYTSLADKAGLWDSLFSKKQQQQKDRKQKISTSQIEIGALELRHMLWIAFIVTLKSLVEFMQHNSVERNSEKAQLIAAYLTHDYREDTVTKIKQLGKEIINEIDSMQHQMIHLKSES